MCPIYIRGVQFGTLPVLPILEEYLFYRSLKRILKSWTLGHQDGPLSQWSDDTEIKVGFFPYIKEPLLFRPGFQGEGLQFVANLVGDENFIPAITVDVSHIHGEKMIGDFAGLDRADFFQKALFVLKDHDPIAVDEHELVFTITV